ncbi:MAG TPA: hypothetical protein PLX04_04540 [Caldisericia bacterium]|nr:hypothetical protein [Caldisericia bacterium]
MLISTEVFSLLPKIKAIHYNKSMGRIGDLILGTYGVLMVIVTTPFLNMVALDSSGSMHSENYFFLSISLIVMYFSHFYLYKVFFGVKKGLIVFHSIAKDGLQKQSLVSFPYLSTHL